MGEKRFEMRFAGSGGQGVILASVILAEAAVIDGLHAVQSQAYGPEARGGVSKAETILSRGQIWYSKVTRPDFLLALTQASLDAYSKTLAEDAVVMFDDSLVPPAELDPARLAPVPILRCAKETVGKAFTANIVALGAINAALRLFDGAVLAEAVRRHIPPGTEDINRKALESGAALISEEQAAAFAAHIG
jgi:2-oxoglutarate ferredoxin oxidoreductase subunit gamma